MLLRVGGGTPNALQILLQLRRCFIIICLVAPCIEFQLVPCKSETRGFVLRYEVKGVGDVKSMSGRRGWGWGVGGISEALITLIHH